MNYTLETQGKIVIFTLKHNKLDSALAPELKAELLIICQSDIDTFIMDLSQVETIDSSGLGCLLLASRLLSEHSIPIVLIGLQTNVKLLIDISRIEHLFEYFDTREEALANINNH